MKSHKILYLYCICFDFLVCYSGKNEELVVTCWTDFITYSCLKNSALREWTEWENFSSIDKIASVLTYLFKEVRYTCVEASFSLLCLFWGYLTKILVHFRVSWYSDDFHFQLFKLFSYLFCQTWIFSIS